MSRVTQRGGGLLRFSRRCSFLSHWDKITPLKDRHGSQGWLSLSPSQHLPQVRLPHRLPPPQSSVPRRLYPEMFQSVISVVQRSNVLCSGSVGPPKYPCSGSLFLVAPGTHPSLAPQARREGRQICEVPENWSPGCRALQGGPGSPPFCSPPSVTPLVPSPNMGART